MSHYATKFLQLSKFALELVFTEAKRVRRFLKGLWVDIYDCVVIFRPGSYVELLKNAQLAEELFIARFRQPGGSRFPELKMKQVAHQVPFFIPTMCVINVERSMSTIHATELPMFALTMGIQDSWQRIVLILIVEKPPGVNSTSSMSQMLKPHQ